MILKRDLKKIIFQKYMNKKFFLVSQFILRSSNVDTNRSSRRMG